jgi:hypothetical protein
MPADDLVLNVRQVAGYPPTSNAPTNASLLMQLGIGGPYVSISPQALVSTALSTGGDMAIGGDLSVQAISGGSAQFSNGMFGMFSAQKACIVDLAATWGTIAGVPIATINDLANVDAAIRAASVWSFNGRRGDVRLWIDDIRCAGGAPIFSPRFEGSPRACTPPPDSNSSRLATTAFVAAAIGGAELVTSFNTRVGAVTLEAADVTALDLPYAPIDSPNFTGYATSLTPPQGTATGQIATTAFVMNAVAESTTGVASFNGRTGIVTLNTADITTAGGAPLFQPAFTGIPSAPTAALGTDTTQLATTAFVQAATGGSGGSFAPINSPAFTGVPTAPTAATGTQTTQIATTAFVMDEINAVNAGVISFNGRTGEITLLANDISAAGGATLTSPAFTGVPTAPTAAPSTNTGQIATTAFVMAQLAATAGVASFNTRTGAVTLTLADVTGVGGAPLASPVFTGTPSGPTPPAANSTTRFATTAFVAGGFLPLTGGSISGSLSATGSMSTVGSGNFGGISLQANVITATGAGSSIGGVTMGNGGNGYLTTAVPGLTGASPWALGWSQNPAGYGSFQLAVSGGGQGYLVRSTPISGSTFGVTLLQLQGGLTSAYMIADGPNQVFFSVATSDGRLKHNLAPPSKDALAIVNEIAVNQCDFRHPGAMNSGEHWDFAVIAEDVEAVMPYAYIAAPPESFSSLHPLHLITVLWKAVQQLTERLEALEARTA